jgi:hypothetical protein
MKLLLGDVDKYYDFIGRERYYDLTVMSLPEFDQRCGQPSLILSAFHVGQVSISACISRRINHTILR